MGKHAELIARLEAAEVGSHMLSSDFCYEIGLYIFDEDKFGKNGPTTSLDAALALAERVLPDVDYRVSAGQHWKPLAELWPQETRTSIIREASRGRHQQRRSPSVSPS